MVKKAVMGTVVSQIINELSPEIPEGAEQGVENEVVLKLKKVLGENWAALPVTGPYMMVAVLVLNYILLPMGVTPVTVADRVMTKSREYELDTRFSDLLLSAKGTAHATGEFTSEKIHELTAYSEEKTKHITPKLKEIVESGQELGKSAIGKGKSLGRGLINGIKNTLDRSDDQEQDEV